MTRGILAIALVGLALGACGGRDAAFPPPPPAPPEPAATSHPAEPELQAALDTPDAPFREKAPAPGPAPAFVPPKIESFSLSNGLRVLMVERHELPIVDVRVVVKAGAGDLAGERAGAASFLGAMLEQGTRKRSALQISDDFEAIGAQHGAWVEWDAGFVTTKVLAADLDKGLELLSDVVLNPTFPDAEVERLRARRLASLAQEKNSPGAMASNALAAALYGRAHPYGNSLSGREDDAKKLKRADLLRLYQRLFTPQNAAIVVAGDVTKATLAPKLEAKLAPWRRGPAVVGKVPAVPARSADAPRVVIVDRPGAPQSQVLVAEPGVPFSNKDRDAIFVMNAILGGMFSSRVNLNLREKHAYTYGARSRFSMRHGPGPFTAGGAMVADKTRESVKELLFEIERIRSEDVSPEELSDAKENLRLAMPGRFETVSDVTGALADLVVYDLPLDEYATRPARIAAVTAADVKRVASTYLHPSSMVVIVVGDRAKVEPELEILRLGKIEVRDAYGDPVPRSK
jgi:predicted Zn-dependent peptidase